MIAGTMAWLVCGELNLSVPAEQILRVVAIEDAPEDSFDLAVLMEAPASQHDGYAVELRDAGVVRLPGVCLDFVGEDAVRRLALPALVADHLHTLGIVGIAQRGDRLAYIVDAARLPTRTE